MAMANHCPKCGFKVGPQTDDCPACGQHVSRMCPHCEHKVFIGSEICNYCGRPLLPVEPVRKVSKEDLSLFIHAGELKSLRERIQMREEQLQKFRASYSHNRWMEIVVTVLLYMILTAIVHTFLIDVFQTFYQKFPVRSLLISNLTLLIMVLVTFQILTVRHERDSERIGELMSRLYYLRERLEEIESRTPGIVGQRQKSAQPEPQSFSQ